jgi:hypothetical protein
VSQQIDIAVDLGVVPPPLPEILTLRQLVEIAPAAPPQIIEGVLHVRSKMILGGTSKSNKSWCLLDLAISVASGSDWWGRRCTKMSVLYINFELHAWAIAQRLNSVAAARPECKGMGDTLHIWNLRGHNADLTLLRPKLEEQLDRHQFGMIILDPAYKVLGNRDENANGDIASLMNEFEALVQRTGAALVVAHHFAKGDSTVKSVIDRMSGAVAWARDPDSILVLTPHEEEECFTVSTVLRNLPRVDDFVVRWDWRLQRRRGCAIRSMDRRRLGMVGRVEVGMESREARDLRSPLPCKVCHVHQSTLGLALAGFAFRILPRMGF